MSGASCGRNDLRIGAAPPTCLAQLGGALVNSIYWPAVQMVMWGFLTQFLRRRPPLWRRLSVCCCRACCCGKCWCAAISALSIAFLEEMWSRNLGHLFVSPIRPWEMATGIIIVSLLRTFLGMIPVSLMAWVFFGYSIYGLGPPLIAFFFILQMFSWSIGLSMSGLIMRVGLSAESFAWAAVFILLPISGVYYPVTILPPLAADHLALHPDLLRVRRHARDSGGKDRALGPHGRSFRPVGALSLDRLSDIPVVLPSRPPRWNAAAAGRIVSRPGAGATPFPDGHENEDRRRAGRQGQRRGNCRGGNQQRQKHQADQMR